MRELSELIQNKKAEARNFLNEDKVAEAKALTEEIKNLQDKLDVETELYEEEKTGVENKMKNTKNKKEVSIEVQAFARALAGLSLTDEMKNALVSNVDADGGVLVPEELVNEIQELRRQHVSLASIVHRVPVQSLKGSLPIEDGATVSNLVDFDEITDLAELDVKFKNIVFAIKNKGGIIPISNTLLANEGSGLPSYVNRQFVKKQVRTENADILAQLKVGKTAKAFADIKAVKKSFNKDLDPGLKGEGFYFVMNADAFGFLDDEVDSQGRPILQPNPTQASQKLLFGYPVVVLSNTELPTTGTTTKKAPIFFGNMEEAIVLFDREQISMAQSSEAAFSRNQTLIRAIAHYDVKQKDADSFVYGELDVTSYLA